MTTLDKSKIIEHIYSKAIYIVFILIVILVSIFQPLFISIGNIQALSRQIAILVVLAVGVTLPLIAGEIDLSSASVAALSSMTIAWATYLQHLHTGIAVILGILVGVAFGLFNGTIVRKVKIPALLVTLGSTSMARGLVWLWRQGRDIPITDTNLIYIFGTGEIYGISFIFIWAIIIIVIGGIMLHLTVFGIHSFATGGGGEIAAQFAGVDIDSVKFKCLFFSGAISGFAGILLAGRLNAGIPTALMGSELDAIAAPILGGVALAGGRGSIFAVIIGALILVAFSNAVVMLGFGAGMQIFVRGTMVVLAVLIGARRK